MLICKYHSFFLTLQPNVLIGMSKTEVKKYIQSLDRSSLEDLVLDLYSARKEARGFLEYAMCPRDNVEADSCKDIIRKEFFPSRGEPRMRFSVCKQAIRNFRALDPHPELLADVLLYLPECAALCADTYGDLWGAFYDSAHSNFVVAMKYIAKHHLQPQFQSRIEKLLHHTKNSGYGFPDMMFAAYHEYSDATSTLLHAFT